MTSSFDPTKLGPGSLPLPPPPSDSVTEFMESYFTELQLKGMQAAGVTLSDFTSPFSDGVKGADEGIPNNLYFAPTLAPPKSTQSVDPLVAEEFIFQSLVNKLPEPYKTEVTTAQRTGKVNPDIAGLVTSLKAYAVYYDGVVKASGIPPIPQQEQWLRQNKQLEQADTAVKALTLSAGKVLADVPADAAATITGFLVSLAENILAYRHILMSVQVEDAQLTAKLGTLSRQNTLAQIDASQKAVQAARDANEAAQAQQTQTNWIVGGILIGLAVIAAALLAIFTLGAGLPASGALIGGVVAGAVGLAVAGANFMAQAAGVPNLGSAIAAAMEHMTDTDAIAISSSIMVLSVLLSIVSMGVLSFASGVSVGLGVTLASVATIGAIGMTAMSEVFTTSVAKAMKTKYLADGMTDAQADKAAQDFAQGMMWMFAALILVASFSGGFKSAAQAIINKIKDMAGIPRVLASFVTSTAEGATAQVGQSVGIGAGEAAGGAGGSAGGAGTTGGVGGAASAVSGTASTAGGAARATAAAATTIEATTSTASMISNVMKTIQKVFSAARDNLSSINQIMQATASFAQAAASFAEYQSLQAQAKVAVAQAEYQQIVTTTDALEKLIDSTIQALVTNQQQSVDQAASMSETLGQVMDSMRQAVTAITSNRAANISYAASGSEPVSEVKTTAPPDKVEQEKAAAVVVPGSAAQVAFTISATSDSGKSGLAGKMFTGTPEGNQQIAVAQLLSTFTNKITDMFKALGLDPRFARKLARELAPGLIKGLLKSGEKKLPESDEQLMEENPILQFLKGMMQENPMVFTEGGSAETAMADLAAKDPTLADFMSQLKGLSKLKAATPEQFSRIVASLCHSLLKMGKKAAKGGDGDAAAAPVELLDLIIGKGGVNQLAVSMNLSSIDELSPLLKKLMEKEENPYEQFNRYLPA